MSFPNPENSVDSKRLHLELELEVFRTQENSLAPFLKVLWQQNPEK